LTRQAALWRDLKIATLPSRNHLALLNPAFFPAPKKLSSRSPAAGGPARRRSESPRFLRGEGSAVSSSLRVPHGPILRGSCAQVPGSLRFVFLLGLGASPSFYEGGSWVCLFLGFRPSCFCSGRSSDRFLGLPFSCFWVPQVRFVNLSLGFLGFAFLLVFGCPTRRLCVWVLGFTFPVLSSRLP